MLISEFAARAGLPRDTVRFYTRIGLLRPQAGTRGGRHRYQEFGADDLQAAAVVRHGQRFGMTLRQIVALDAERRAGAMNADRVRTLLAEQLAQVAAQRAILDDQAAYLRDKLARLDDAALSAGRCACAT